MKARDLFGFTALAMVITLVTAVALTANAGTSGRHRGHGGDDVKYDADVDQACKVNVEFSEVKDSDICTPEADVRQGGAVKKPSGDGQKDDGLDGHHDHEDRDGARKSVTITNQEKTTCEAQGEIAVNQCDVGDDATFLGAQDGPGRNDASSSWSLGREGERSWYGGHHGSVTYTNQEKTTCEAEGVIALNQCDVDGDATALTLGGLTRPVTGALGGVLG